MAGVCSSDLTDLKLANIPAEQVTSRTRFTWSEREVAVFETFVRYKRISTKPSKISAVDLEPLMVDLNLDRFLSIENNQGDQLRPIIETKVRRKLAAIDTDLEATEHVGKSMLPEKTRLQTARARAIAAGKEPPARLPKPSVIYTPELWKSKPKPKPRRRDGAATEVPSTVEEAQRQVHQLEEALKSARLRLSQLQQEAQVAQELEEARSDQQEQPQQQQQQKTKEGEEEEMRKGRHGADPKIGKGSPAGVQAIDEISDSEPDAVDSDPDSDPNRSQDRAVAPNHNHNMTIPSPLGSKTPQTIVPTSRKALLTLENTDSTTKADEPARIPRVRRLRADRTLASLARDGAGDGDDDDEDELTARLRNIGNYLKAKQRKAD